MIRRTTFVVLVLTLAVAGQLVGAGPAAANKPISIFSRSIHFVCSDVRNSNGVISITAEDFSEFNEADGSIQYWKAPDSPDTSPDPTFVSSPLIEDQHVTRTGNHFEGTILMLDLSTFEPVGNASFSVDLIPTSGVRKVGGRSKQGNRNIHDNSTVQFFSVEGIATMHDGSTFDLTNCIGPDGAPSPQAGADFITDVRITDPSQFTIKFAGVLVLCDIVTPDYAFNFGASNEAGPRAELFFENANGTLGGFSDEITLTNTEMSGAVPVTDGDGNPAGDAELDVTFTRGEHIVVRTQEGSIRTNRQGFQLIPEGTVTLPGGTAVDVSTCFAFDGMEQQKEHRPKEGA